MESHLEARLWNDVFLMAQDQLGIPRGSIRATVLIETIPAAFEMDEILYELREHSAGLNCGRWDYIFSIIKKFQKHADFTMPDRAQVTMTTHCMHSYSLLAIKTCHRRGIHAIGGMAAQIPIKNDPAANEKALEAVRADKVREAGDGHDGTWVAHPGLVGIAKAAFDAKMPEPHQIDRRRDDVQVTSKDLLTVPSGEITERGLCHNIDVGIQYMATWLGGNGCVPLYNLMEDAATAEISRAQIWQWIHHPNGVLADGRKVTPQLVRRLFQEQMDKLRQQIGAGAFCPRQLPSSGGIDREHRAPRRLHRVHDVGGIRAFGLVLSRRSERYVRSSSRRCGRLVASSGATCRRTARTGGRSCKTTTPGSWSNRGKAIIAGRMWNALTRPRT